MIHPFHEDDQGLEKDLFGSKGSNYPIQVNCIPGSLLISDCIKQFPIQDLWFMVYKCNYKYNRFILEFENGEYIARFVLLHQIQVIGKMPVLCVSVLTR